jgi:hypothetical protein
MITVEQANDFSRHWIKAWNDHDIDAVMEHYIDEVEFYSPVIAALNVNAEGKIIGVVNLRAYFLKGLAAYPDLHFQLNNVYTGVNSIVVHYISVNSRMALEVFELNDEGKVMRVLCNYLDA